MSRLTTLSRRGSRDRPLPKEYLRRRSASVEYFAVLQISDGERVAVEGSTDRARQREGLAPRFKLLSGPSGLELLLEAVEVAEDERGYPVSLGAAQTAIWMPVDAV